MATDNLQIHQGNPLTFSINLTDEDDRLDCAWFNPDFENEINNLRDKKRNNRKLVKLNIVASVSGGKRLPKGTILMENEFSIIPYIRAAEVKNQKINFELAPKITRELHHIIQEYQLKKNDLVMTIVGTIGEVGVLDQDIDVCDFSENVARLRVKDDSVLTKFLLYFLDSKFGRIQSERHKVGSLQFKLPLASCRNIEIYIPFNGHDFDSSAQRKILDESDKLFKEAEEKERRGLELIDCANSVVMNTLKIELPDKEPNIYTHSPSADTSLRLDALYNNPFRTNLLAGLKKYRHENLGNLTKPQSKEKVGVFDFYKLIELEQINEKTGKITSVKEVSVLGSQKVLLKSDSILIAKLLPEKGKIAIVPNEYDGAVGSSELIPLRLNSGEVSLKYLWAFLRSDYVLKQWAYVHTGLSRMRIDSTQLSQTVIIIPDKKIQDQIVKEIEMNLEKSKKLFKESSKLYEKGKNAFIESLLN